jgi:hypothetical protein
MIMGVALPAFADSPLTSIDFAQAYADLPVMKELQHGRKQAAYELLASHASTDQKLAVANALGWGKNNASAFSLRIESERPGDAGPEDAFVTAYLQAMDDYLDIKPATVALADKAARALPDDFTVQYTAALIHAQLAMEGSWCDVYKGPAAVLERFSPSRRNLRPAAIALAQEYLRGYADECPGSPESNAKHKEELNQIYTLARLGDQIVAGTQAGVVVWSVKGGRPIAVREGFICSTLAWRDSVWAGCEGEVVRWDGRAFKTFLTRKAKNTSEYYHPMRGKDGALWVRLGKKLYAFDGERFNSIEPPWKGSAYDALVRLNGEVWSIDFLRGIAGPKPYALRSADYPGSDPRTLVEDEAGTLWVQDFESGLFRLGADGRFVKQPGLDAKASGVADRGGVLLHYTDGLVIDGQRMPLPELEYMRDLKRDEDGTLWVAGWHGFVRVSRDGTKQLFRSQ